MKHLAPEEREDLEALNEMLSAPGFTPQSMDPDDMAYWKQVAANPVAFTAVRLWRWLNEHHFEPAGVCNVSITWSSEKLAAFCRGGNS